MKLCNKRDAENEGVKQRSETSMNKRGEALEMRKLVQSFADAVVEHCAAKTPEVNWKYASQMREAFFTLIKKYGDAGREALTVLFKHEDPDVRLEAAVWLLRYAHEESMAILREFSSYPGMIGFGARQTIENWNSGDWEIDPGP